MRSWATSQSNPPQFRKLETEAQREGRNDSPNLRGLVSRHILFTHLLTYLLPIYLLNWSGTTSFHKIFESRHSSFDSRSGRFSKMSCCLLPFE